MARQVAGRNALVALFASQLAAKTAATATNQPIEIDCKRSKARTQTNPNPNPNPNLNQTKPNLNSNQNQTKIKPNKRANLAAGRSSFKMDARAFESHWKFERDSNWPFKTRISSFEALKLRSFEFELGSLECVKWRDDETRASELKRAAFRVGRSRSNKLQAPSSEPRSVGQLEPAKLGRVLASVEASQLNSPT